MVMRRFAGNLRLAGAFVTLAALAAASVMAAGGGLTVADAWVRMAPPTSTTHAAYLTIRNEGTATQELVALYSDAYASIQIHATTVENGVARMEQLKAVEIPAGGKVEFAPGGLHLMLIGARKPLEHGALIPIRLGFRKGTKIEFEAIVVNHGFKAAAEPAQPGPAADGGHKPH